MSYHRIHYQIRSCQPSLHCLEDWKCHQYRHNLSMSGQKCCTFCVSSARWCPSDVSKSAQAPRMSLVLPALEAFCLLALQLKSFPWYHRSQSYVCSKSNQWFYPRSFRSHQISCWSYSVFQARSSSSFVQSNGRDSDCEARKDHCLLTRNQTCLSSAARQLQSEKKPLDDFP